MIEKGRIFLNILASGFKDGLLKLLVAFPDAEIQFLEDYPIRIPWWPRCDPPFRLSPRDFGIFHSPSDDCGLVCCTRQISTDMGAGQGLGSGEVVLKLGSLVC